MFSTLIAAFFDPRRAKQEVPAPAECAASRAPVAAEPAQFAPDAVAAAVGFRKKSLTCDLSGSHMEGAKHGGGRRWRKSDEALSAGLFGGEPGRLQQQRVSRTPDLRRSPPRLYQQRVGGRSGVAFEIESAADGVPISRATSSSTLFSAASRPVSYQFGGGGDASSLLGKSSSAAVAYGRSRRMSRSLPELRDIQFVSVLPDLEEEASDDSEFEEQVEVEKPSRTPWHRKLDFLWCSVCQALGLSNFWRFPYYCYSNGGGSFVLAYIIFMVVCSVPFLCMELAVGQATQSGPISAFGQLCPLMKGIGVASMMLSFWLTAYYGVLVSWTIFYTFNSFYSPPRWTRCTNTWNSPNCLEQVLEIVQTSPSTEASTMTSSADSGPMNNISILSTFSSFDEKNASLFHQENASIADSVGPNPNITHPAVEFLNLKMLEKSDNIEETGELRFELVAAVLFVWFLTYFALRKADFFRGTTVYVLTIVSHLLLFCIFLRTVALDGAKSGLHYLFKPEWDQMLNPRVLLYALAQAFHSLGVVLGPSILMGSCHKTHNNVLRDTIVLTIVTLLTVLMVGCVTFGTIGHLAAKMQKPFWEVLSDDPSNVFVLYSIVIGSMPLPSCWGVIFFLVFLCLGLDSQIKLMATLVSALKEAYTYYIKQRFQGHSLFLAAICGVCFVASIQYLTQAGIFFLQLVDHYIAVIATTVVALLEVCTLGWLYGASNLSSCIQQMTGKTPSNFYQFTWMILSPLTILGILVYAAFTMGGSDIRRDYVYPGWAHVMGWVMFSLTLCWIPFLAIAAYRKAPKSHLFSRLKTTIQPRLRSHSDSMWEPKPVIILNGSTVTASEFPDYKLPELPTVPNSVQSYVDKHSKIVSQNAESMF